MGIELECAANDLTIPRAFVRAPRLYENIPPKIGARRTCSCAAFINATQNLWRPRFWTAGCRTTAPFGQRTVEPSIVVTAGRRCQFIFRHLRKVVEFHHRASDAVAKRKVKCVILESLPLICQGFQAVADRRCNVDRRSLHQCTVQNFRCFDLKANRRAGHEYNHQQHRCRHAIPGLHLICFQPRMTRLRYMCPLTSLWSHVNQIVFHLYEVACVCRTLFSRHNVSLHDNKQDNKDDTGWSSHFPRRRHPIRRTTWSFPKDNVVLFEVEKTVSDRVLGSGHEL